MSKTHTCEINNIAVPNTPEKPPDAQQDEPRTCTWDDVEKALAAERARFRSANRIFRLQ